MFLAFPTFMHVNQDNSVLCSPRFGVLPILGVQKESSNCMSLSPGTVECTGTTHVLEQKQFVSASNHGDVQSAILAFSVSNPFLCAIFLLGYHVCSWSTPVGSHLAKRLQRTNSTITHSSSSRKMHIFRRVNANQIQQVGSSRESRFSCDFALVWHFICFHPSAVLQAAKVSSNNQNPLLTECNNLLKGKALQRRKWKEAGTTQNTWASTT